MVQLTAQYHPNMTATEVLQAQQKWYATYATIYHTGSGITDVIKGVQDVTKKDDFKFKMLDHVEILDYVPDGNSRPGLLGRRGEVRGCYAPTLKKPEVHYKIYFYTEDKIEDGMAIEAALFNEVCLRKYSNLPKDGLDNWV